MALEQIFVELLHEHFDEFWPLSTTLCFLLLKKSDKM